MSLSIPQPGPGMSLSPLLPQNPKVPRQPFPDGKQKTPRGLQALPEPETAQLPIRTRVHPYFSVTKHRHHLACHIIPPHILHSSQIPVTGGKNTLTIHGDDPVQNPPSPPAVKGNVSGTKFSFRPFKLNQVPPAPKERKHAVAFERYRHLLSLREGLRDPGEKNLIVNHQLLHIHTHGTKPLAFHIHIWAWKVTN